MRKWFKAEIFVEVATDDSDEVTNIISDILKATRLIHHFKVKDLKETKYPN